MKTTRRSPCRFFVLGWNIWALALVEMLAITSFAVAQSAGQNGQVIKNFPVTCKISYQGPRQSSPQSQLQDEISDVPHRLPAGKENSWFVEINSLRPTNEGGARIEELKKRLLAQCKGNLQVKNCAVSYCLPTSLGMR